MLAKLTGTEDCSGRRWPDHSYPFAKDAPKMTKDAAGRDVPVVAKDTAGRERPVMVKRFFRALMGEFAALVLFGVLSGVHVSYYCVTEGGRYLKVSYLDCDLPLSAALPEAEMLALEAELAKLLFFLLRTYLREKLGMAVKRNLVSSASRCGVKISLRVYLELVHLDSGKTVWWLDMEALKTFAFGAFNWIHELWKARDPRIPEHLQDRLLWKCPFDGGLLRTVFNRWVPLGTPSLPFFPPDRNKPPVSHDSGDLVDSDDLDSSMSGGGTVLTILHGAHSSSCQYIQPQKCLVTVRKALTRRRRRRRRRRRDWTRPGLGESVPELTLKDRLHFAKLDGNHSPFFFSAVYLVCSFFYSLHFLCFLCRGHILGVLRYLRGRAQMLRLRHFL